MSRHEFVLLGDTMNLAWRQGERLEDSVNLTFTRREVLFLDLCLRLVARDHARNGTACSDVELLRDRLAISRITAKMSA
jgi:hypothetical protein